jgi:hypothetical protein
MKKALLVIAVLIAAYLGGVTSFSTAKAVRNSAGTYSLATGNPVVSGTTISSYWANNTVGDIATELTNSLDRYGRGGMLAQLKAANGTSGVPSYSFAGSTASGLYSPSTDEVRMVINGATKTAWNALGFYVFDLTNTYGTRILGGIGSYTMTLPDVVPASTLPVTMDTTGALATAQISTNQIADGAVTKAKLATVLSQSSSCGSFSTSSVSFVDVTNLSVTITTVGHPVVIEVIPDEYNDSSIFNNNTTGGWRAAIVDGSNELCAIVSQAAGKIPSTTLRTIAVLSPGTHTLKIKVSVLNVGTVFLYSSKLVAYEL